MPTTTTLAQRRDRFRALHREGLFVMPNPMDVGLGPPAGVDGLPGAGDDELRVRRHAGPPGLRRSARLSCSSTSRRWRRPSTCR